MRAKQSLLKSESGVIHHLGLIVFGVALIGVIGFAVFRIQAEQNDPAFTNEESSISEVNATQAELDGVAKDNDDSIKDADSQVDQVKDTPEDSDES